MRTGLVTLYDQTYATLASVTIDQTRKKYAARHGYDLITKTDGFINPHPLLGFEKIRYLLEILNSGGHDLLYWAGADVSITNHSIPISTMMYDGYHVTISGDSNGINADSFVVRNTVEGRAWLEMVMSNMDAYRDHHWQEQQAMIDTYHEWKQVVKYLPQRFMNSYHYRFYTDLSGIDEHGFRGEWQKGDFALHTPAIHLKRRIDAHQSIMQSIVE